jgi:hypothetical protein
MEQTSPIQEPGAQTPPPPAMSLAGRLLNVFATPADVFDGVKAAKDSAANWVVPGVLLVLIGWASLVVIFSQDSIKHQLTEITDQAIQKQLEQSHLNEQQAETARAMGEKWAAISAKIGAAIIPLLAAFVAPFIWGLFIWLVGTQVWKREFPYMKAVEVVGLGNMIGVLDMVVKTLLIVGLGNLYASPSLVLLVKDFDPQNTTHGLLGLANVMTIWVLGVRAVGLARLSGVSFAKAALWVYGFWAAHTGFLIGLGLTARMFLKRIGG